MRANRSSSTHSVAPAGVRTICLAAILLASILASPSVAGAGLGTGAQVVVPPNPTSSDGVDEARGPQVALPPIGWSLGDWFPASFQGRWDFEAEYYPPADQ